jgi:hypothetical protein
MADPAKVRLTTSLRLGGFFGFVGGFLMAYQRSSRESPLVMCSMNSLMFSFLVSPFLGLVREQERGGLGLGRAFPKGS